METIKLVEYLLIYLNNDLNKYIKLNSNKNF